MRDPIMRAFSEWSMFALGWFWEKNTNFEHKVSQQMRTFRECNTTLFHDVEKLKTIPPAELEAYLTKCFRGRAMEYVSTSVRPPTFLPSRARARATSDAAAARRRSRRRPRRRSRRRSRPHHRRSRPHRRCAAAAPQVYSVCILNALRVFDRSQFLFLRFEDLMGMNAPALLKLLSNFTGLHTDAQIINQMRSANQCEVRPSSEESSDCPPSPLAAAQHPHARRAARLRPPPPTSHHLPQARSAKKKPLSFTKRDDSNASQAARAALERVKPQVCTPRPAGRRAQSRPPTRALPLFPRRASPRTAAARCLLRAVQRAPPRTRPPRLPLERRHARPRT